MREDNKVDVGSRLRSKLGLFKPAYSARLSQRERNLIAVGNAHGSRMYSCDRSCKDRISSKDIVHRIPFHTSLKIEGIHPQKIACGGVSFGSRYNAEASVLVTDQLKCTVAILPMEVVKFRPFRFDPRRTVFLDVLHQRTKGKVL